MRTVIELITPERAQAMLKGNTENRTVRQGHVDTLARVILSGQWRLTHQGVALAENGRLLDGQHRLMAIVQAGLPVRMLVSYGVDEAVFKVTDCGIKREAADRLHILDHPGKNKKVVEVVSAYLRYAVRETRGALTANDIETTFLELADHWSWVVYEFPAYGVIARAPVLAALAVYHSVHPLRAELFANKLKTGVDLPAGSPILALIRLLTSANSLGSSNSGQNYWRTTQAAYLDLEGRSIIKIYPAAVDFLGNTNSQEVLRARTARTLRGAETKRAKAMANG